ncbi:hypothetical protein [Cellulomonas carbonis]|uniref:Uncharacterized protein n=1 Tax=Cellulomonas carbonis T26 TaxID=947969 RepID=A0A0A0BVY3_9CELL|nr:hypothetical protein [Cellulomonas carbonis]KGM11832.1 hypothetical protein N868_06105 [Cellulomonas carbonis T26]GGB92126.1 hypothetical protein GCM10010972_00990 [Cellulomonas carbonis]
MEQQAGWRVCRRCQGLISTRVPPGGCLDQDMHDFTFGADYRVHVTGAQAPDLQPGWSACTRCARLVFTGAPGVCHDGAPHEHAPFTALSVRFGTAADDEEAGWRWCSRCQCLNDTAVGSRRCFAGGDHDLSAGHAYSVPVVRAGVQTWWAWCSECQGVVITFGAGVCHDGEQHRLTGVELYAVPFGAGSPGSEGGWQACTGCGLLSQVEAADAAAGPCAAGGPHALTGALAYRVGTGPAPPGAQGGWQACVACRVLVFTGFDPGPCVAGGTHQPDELERHLHLSSVLAGEPGWRRCGACHVLTSLWLGEGPCAVAGTHDLTASAAYAVPQFGAPEGGETGWRWCRRCQALVQGHEPGLCVGTAPHLTVDSELYGVHQSAPPERAERGWAMCRRCRSLVRPPGEGEPGGTGLCPDGGAHDLTASAAYAVEVLPGPAVEETPTGPRLGLTERADGVVVEGRGFPSAAAVELTVVAEADVTTATTTADADGAFTHTFVPVVPDPAGATLLVRADDGSVASGRLTAFVPGTPAPPGAAHPVPDPVPDPVPGPAG